MGGFSILAISIIRKYIENLPAFRTSAPFELSWRHDIEKDGEK